MLKLTMSWVWDCGNKSWKLVPRMWKISNVVIGEILLIKPNGYRMNAEEIQVHTIRSIKGRDTWERIKTGSPTGDYDMEVNSKRWNQSFNGNKRFFFFRTKNEAEQKLLSIRDLIESYYEMEVARYRDATMYKIGKMNKVFLKFDKIADKVKR
jgi:hypothetical protein